MQHTIPDTLFHYLLQTNTFQCVMATDGVISFVIFLYAEGEIQWTTGDASDGVGGLGGTPAQVGFNAGDGVRFATIPNSRTDAIVNIDEMPGNTGKNGSWVFKVSEFEVDTGECGPDSKCVIHIMRLLV